MFSLLSFTFYNSDNGNWKQFDPSDLIKNVCPEKDTKFVEIHTSAILLVGSRMKMTSWQYIVEEFMKKTPQVRY